VKVLAPIAALDYAGASARRFGRGRVPFRRSDGPLEVLHPMWMYPPGGGALNTFLLYLRLLPCALRIRRRYRPQLIDAHFGYPDGVSACFLAATLRIPFTITLRGNESLHACRPLRGLLMRWAMRRAARVIAISERLADLAAKAGVPPEKIRLIPNGVDSTIFHPRDQAACRRKHGVSLDAKIVLSAGTLIERKGHHRVIDAIARLAGEGVPCQLIIAGGPGREGHFEQVIQRTLRDSGLESDVRLKGHVDPVDLAELMCAADVLVLASTREGWPNVVHEAMACGLPVVATDVGAIPQMIPSPASGVVVPVNDRGGLVDALRTALHQRWDRSQIASWAQARSWDAVAFEVAREMRNVISAEDTGEIG
jgi:glycosyltransferase involved in cell wall biosynthesis